LSLFFGPSSGWFEKSEAIVAIFEEFASA